MADIVMKSRVLNLRKEYTTLTATNPVLKEGEMIFAVVSPDNEPAQQLLMIKVGDGTTPFNNLNWISALASDVYDWAKASNKPSYNASEILLTDGDSIEDKYLDGTIAENAIIDGGTWEA